MKFRTLTCISVALAAGMLTFGACTVSDTDKAAPDTSTAQMAPAPSTQPAMPGDTIASQPLPTPAAAPVRVKVDLTARKLTLFENNAAVSTHPIAVGSAEWPTQKGEWTIKQVVFNPEWTPPDESWAEERTPRQPGDPLNPLGHAQLVYDPPRTVHGTNQPTSIGKAVSHGSIRMNNAEIVALGKRLMTATGVGKDDAWYREAATKRTVKQIVDLPTPVPIRVF